MNNGKLCISICASTVSEMLDLARSTAVDCDLIEMRLDCLSELNANDLTDLDENMILTLRPQEQGGNRVISIDERIGFWSNASGGCGADVEEDMIGKVDVSKFQPQILSFHDHSRTPDVDAVYERLRNVGADLIKIAVTANGINDTIAIWNLIERARIDGQNIVAVAMGEAGKWTRILGLAHGAYLTYAAIDRGGETAPGQITARDMIDVYRVKKLNKQTDVYGIIAGDTSYSMSPYIHNAAFKAAGINAVFVPLQVTDLDAFMRRMVLPAAREIDLNFRGFAVTNPHKTAIIKYCDRLDKTAESIGSVNTVKIDNEKLIGYNTDAAGFIGPLEKRYGDLKNARVAVVGAGGAARACVYALKQAGTTISIMARSAQKALALAKEFKVKNEQLSAGIFSEMDILVHATPLGTRGSHVDEAIATADQLRGVRLVYDLIYNPLETRLLRECRMAGADTLNGFDMLVAQAAEQFKIWTGLEPPVIEMSAAARKKLDEY